MNYSKFVYEIDADNTGTLLTDWIKDTGYQADLNYSASTSETCTNEYNENTSDVENWEVSDFSSSGDLSDGWTPDK